MAEDKLATILETAKMRITRKVRDRSDLPMSERHKEMFDDIFIEERRTDVHDAPYWHPIAHLWQGEFGINDDKRLLLKVLNQFPLDMGAAVMALLADFNKHTNTTSAPSPSPPDVLYRQSVEITAGELAKAIAISAAKDDAEKRDYTEPARQGQPWEPHGWVVDAIKQALQIKHIPTGPRTERLINMASVLTEVAKTVTRDAAIPPSMPFDNRDDAVGVELAPALRERIRRLFPGVDSAVHSSVLFHILLERAADELQRAAVR